MAIEYTKAADALTKAAQLGGMSGMEARDKPAPGQFADMVRDVAESAIEAGENAERLSAAAIQDKAELTEVVTAITNAEVTLQTVVAVRDRIISAYQQILRMPI
jgi:flagellar hook-basal body complex protein FliE